MVAVDIAFFVVSAIIFIGYAGLTFFKKTKVSEIIVLLLIGVLLGPVFGFLGASELVIFQGFLPFFASFALMIILFEGGMQLNFFKTLRSLPSAIIFTFSVFVLTLLLVAGLWFAFTGNILQGLLLGAILGGTSSAVIIPIVNNTSAKEETKTLLGLESALTDALCVISAVAVASFIALLGSGGGASVSFASIGSSILAAFSIAAVGGFVFGLIWVKLLSFFEKKPYEYLLTLAVLMLLYSIVEYFGGNGAIAALVFGLVLGNSEDLTTMLRLTPRKVEGTIKSFQMEVSFLVRTFFFVYLGLLFKPSYLNDFFVITVSAGIILIILISRFFGAKIASVINKEFSSDSFLITTMNARGLAAASLMSFPIIVGLGMGSVFEQMTAIVFIIIFVSNIATTIGVFFSEKEYDAKKVKLQKVSITQRPNLD
ncbi:MAG: cation:proton antiporter [archaeon]